MIEKGFFPGFDSKEIYEKATKPNDKHRFLSLISGKKFENLKENEEFKKIDEERKRKVVKELVEERIKLSMELEKTTSIMINSMGIGAIVALMGGFMPSYVGTKLGFITQNVQVKGKLGYFN